MLVLGRKGGESILIGNDIRVEIISAVGGKVKVGIVAPSNVIVMREELNQQKEIENEHSELCNN